MTQRLVRWSLFLSEFNFKILYRSGASNGKPDALSRRPDYLDSPVDDEATSFSILKPENFCAIASSVSFLNDFIIFEYKNDTFYSDICNYLENKSLPIPHPQISNFRLVTVFSYSTQRYIFLLTVVLPFSNFAMILPPPDILASRKLVILYLEISGGLLYIKM